MGGEWNSDASRVITAELALWDTALYELVPFSYAIEVNPSIKLARGETYAFVDMAQIDPNRSLVYSMISREFKGGGSRFQDGDTLFARITPCLENGKIARYASTGPDQLAHGSTEFIVLRGREGISDNDFVFYLARSEEFRDYAIGRMNGSSGRQRVPTDAFSGLGIPLPPLPEQRRIAKILGDLDDKIELNRKMNETLEQMARALFKSWFVDFDPVRAKMEGRTPTGMDAATAALFPERLVDSELGMIPEGWEVGSLGQIVDCFDSKRIPLSGRQREARRGSFPYYGAASVMDYIDGYLFDGVYLLVGEDGSVINEDGTPVLQYAWGKFWVNNHAHVLQAKNGFCTEHLMLLMKDMNIAAYVTGAVQPKLNQGNLFRIPLMIPPEVIGDAFAEVLKPSYSAIRHNIHQSRTLSTLRDTLLPKLVSGEVRVGEGLERV